MSNESIFHKQGDAKVSTPEKLIKDTINKVKAILQESFPDHLEFDEGRYTIGRGSTQVMIVVRPFTETETVIECMSNVVSGAKIDNKLMTYLLRKNAEIHFGSFGLIFDDTIVFQNSLTGTHIDKNELVTAVNAVAIISDHYDDEIVEMAGGKRAIDMAESELADV